MISGYFFPDIAPVFLLDLADFAGFPITAFLCFPLACCLAGVVECFGLATLAPMVTGASSCSAALGVASDATLKTQNETATITCSTLFVRDFIYSCPIPLSFNLKNAVERNANIVSSHPQIFSRREKGANPIALWERVGGEGQTLATCCCGGRAQLQFQGLNVCCLFRMAKVHWLFFCGEFYFTHCTFQATLLVGIHSV